MAELNTSKKLLIIHRFAGGSHKILRSAFKRRTTRIAENFTLLGKPMRDRTVRKMFEVSTDVRRRNMLENTCLLLGSAHLESARAFEIIWQFLASYADELRDSSPRFSGKSLDEAFSEVRFANASLERKFYRGELKSDPQPLLFAEESLRSLLTHLHLGAVEQDEDVSMFSIYDFSPPAASGLRA